MTVTNKAFPFATTAEGFTGNPGDTSITMSYESGYGNPSGALKCRCFGRNKTATSYWEWTGTWEDLGVTPGDVVTQVRLNNADTRCTEWNVVDAVDMGPYSIYDSAGTTLIATLWAGRSATGVEGSWTAEGTQTYQSVAAAYEASNTSIRIRLYNTLDNANNASAASAFHEDNVSIDIDHEAAAVDQAFIQEYFRIRKTDNEGLNDAFAAGDPAENTNTTIGTGNPFRIRFKTRETAGGTIPTVGFKAQCRHPEGQNVWRDVNTTLPGAGSISPAFSELSNQFADGDNIPMSTAELLTSTTTNVDGEGDEQDNATALTYVLTNAETEFEFCFAINSWYDDGSTAYQIVAGDTIEFRLVENDGTLFGGTYTNPIITVAETDYYIGCTFVETPGRILVSDTNGNLYILVEPTEAFSRFLLLKSTDGGKTWREPDAAGAPTTVDIEAVDMVSDGNGTLHIATRSATSSTERTFYHRFRMSDHATTQDDWEIIDEIVKTAPVTYQSVAIEWRPTNSDVVLFWVETDTNDIIKYNIRNGSWGTEQTLDSQASTEFTYVTTVLGEGDIVHIFYSDTTNGYVYWNRLNLSDALTTRQQMTTGAIAAGSYRGSMTTPVYWDDAGAEKIMIGLRPGGSPLYLYSEVITDEGAPETRKQVSDTAQGDVARSPGTTTSDQIVADMAVDGTTVYVLYADDSTLDIWLDSALNDGGWSTDTELHDGVTAHWIRSHIFTHSSGNGGDKVLGYIWDNGSSGGVARIWYDEYVISGTDALTAVGITTTPTLGVPTLGQTHALTAVGITTTPTLGVPTVAVPGEIKTAVAQFVANTSSGNQDLTTSKLGGLTPKAAIFSISYATVNGTPVDGTAWSIGWVDENGNAQATAWCAADNVDPTDSGGRFVPDPIVVADPADQQVEARGEFVSWITNGIRINWPVGEVPASAFLINAWFIAGDVETEVGSLLMNETVGLTASTTAPGFEPDILIGQMLIGLTDAGVDENGVHWRGGWGVAINDGSETQRGIGAQNRNGNIAPTPSDVRTSLNTNYFVRAVANTGGSWEYSTELTSFDTNGFTVTTRDGSRTDTELLWLAIKLDGVRQFSLQSYLTKSGTTGEQADTTPGFTPETLLIGMTMQEAEDTVDVTNTIGGTFGLAMADPSDLLSLTWRGDSGVVPPDEATLIDNDINLPNEDGTTGITATIPTGGIMDATGFTLDFTDVETNGKRWFVLAIEEGGDTEDDLTAVGITATPTLGVPTLGQTHALTSVGITTNPVLDTPAVGQEHVLTAVGITANPVLDTPAVGQEDVLTAVGIIANPVLDTPAVGQEHILSATGTTNNPVVGTPAIGQKHILSATGTTNNPVLDTPTLGVPASGTVKIAVKQFQVPSSTGNTNITTTDLAGLTPKAVFIFSSNVTSLNSSTANATICMGAATASGDQWIIFQESKDNQTLTDTRRYGNTGYLLRHWDFDTPDRNTGIFVDFVTNGCTINFTEADLPNTYYTAIFFAGTDLSAHAGMVNGPAQSSSVDVTAPGFEPTIVLHAMSGKPIQTTLSGYSYPGFGATANKATDERGYFVTRRDDGFVTSKSVYRISHDGSSYKEINDTGGSVYSWDVDSWDANGFSFTHVDGEPAVEAIGYLALDTGSQDVTVEIIDTPTTAISQGYTGFGFKPQFAILLQSLSTTDDTSHTSGAEAACFGIGVITSTAESSHSNIDKDGVSTTVAKTKVNSLAANICDDDGAVEYEATLESFDSDGMTLDFTTVPGTAHKWLVIAVEESAATTEDDLTAVGITTTPVTGTPALGQEHDLTATGITADPVTGAPTLGQIHALTAVGITADPVLDIPTVGQEHALTAVGITADPVTSAPTLGQVHALTAVGISADPVLGTPVISTEGEDTLDAVSITADPVLGTPSVGQEHALTAVGITADPVTSAPTLGQIHALDAVGITADSVVGTPTAAHIHDLTAVGITADPVVGTPTAAHIHDLTAVGITADPVTGIPSIVTEGEDNLLAEDITADPVTDTPALGQTHVLDAVGITVGPTLDTPALGQTHVLDAVGTTATPVLGISSIGQTHVLDASETTTTPVLGTPSMGGEQTLDAVDITVDPVVDTPSLGQTHVLDAVDITTNPIVGLPILEVIRNLIASDIAVTPVLDIPTMGHEYVLSAEDVTTTPVLGTPVLGAVGEDDLEAADITSTPIVGTPTLGQTHILNPTGIITTPIVEDTAIGQTHALDAVDIYTTPVVDTSILSHIHVLNAVDITTTPVVEPSTIGQIHVLDSMTILVTPILDTPIIGQTHIISAVGITTTPILGVATWELIEDMVIVVFSTMYPEVRFSSYKPIGSTSSYKPEISFTTSTED
jgi:hypothetical protein